MKFVETPFVSIFFKIYDFSKSEEIHLNIDEPTVTGFNHARKMLFSLSYLSYICNLRLGTVVNELITMTTVHKQGQASSKLRNIYLA